MIDAIRAFIDANRPSIPGLGALPYTVSTFHHGKGEASKVLFLIAAAEKPVAIGKLMRHREYDRMLENEYEALRAHAQAGPFRAPRAYASTSVAGLTFTLEEAAAGRVASAAEAAALAPLVAQFSARMPRLGSVDAAALLALLPEAPERARELAAAVPALDAAESHGDLTFRNILLAPGVPVLIDWSEYGLRPLAHIDLAHYLLRLGKGSVRGHAAALGIDADALELLALLDAALDRMKKADRPRYEALCRQLRSLIRP
jgi:hypothetical protein